MNRPRRGRAGMTAASALLIAAASALSAGLGAAWSAPPRYDGAGYAVLARAILEGQGYRAIDHPDRPRHAHFPPGYPLMLAAVWRVAGVSVVAARAASVACTAGAVLLAWCWFRRMMPGASALLLGLALAGNWLWARTGAAIQSEPLYLLLGQAAILAAARGAHPVMLGVLLAASMLTRQVAVGLAMAVLIDLALRGRWRRAMGVAMIAAAIVSPWPVWIASASMSGERSQAELLLRGGDSWPGRVAGQAVFYVRRIPDQVVGPFVEVGTGRGGNVARAADLWAAVATGVIVFGWIRCLRRPRRRLAGVVPLGTLAVLLVWPFTEAGRFLVPLIPCLLVGAVEGLVVVLGALGRVGLRIGARRAPYKMRSTRWRVVAAGVVLAASVPYSMYAIAAGKGRAAEAAQSEFDAACAWIAHRAGRPGPVLARHPGDVFWQTGRPALEVATSERPGDLDADADAIARTIDRYGVAYLLVDRERYAGAPPSPLDRFVARFPGRVRRAWDGDVGRSSVVVYEVEPGP